MLVLRYEGTAFHVSTGSSHTAIYPFLAEHAIEAGVELTEASYRIPFTS